MKAKLLSLLCACIVLALPFFTSCKDEVIPESESDKIVEHFELTVTEDRSSSRVALENDGLTTMWEPNDQLVLVDKTHKISPIYLTSTLTQKARKATFVSSHGVPVGDYYVFYNYDDKLVYYHQDLQDINKINKDKLLSLWGEISVTDNMDKATVSLKHVYAKVKFDLKNFPSTKDIEAIGIYSTKKGFPFARCLTANGFEDCMTGIGRPLITSNVRRQHMRLYEYSVYDRNNLDYTTFSALVLPIDLGNEDVYFYLLRDNTCYEFKKTNVKFSAGTSYRVVLDYNQKNAEFNARYDTQRRLLIGNLDEWRHAVYRSNNETDVVLEADLDFAKTQFMPLNVKHLEGQGHTIRNITYQKPEQEDVGLLKYEYTKMSVKNVGARYFWPGDKWHGISNLTLENIHMTGLNYVGAFGGMNIEATNCKLIGSSRIEAKGNDVGGLSGCNWIRFACFLKSVYIGENTLVTGKNFVGGILGSLKSSNERKVYYDNTNLFNDCISKCKVVGSGDCVGGIFGYMGPEHSDQIYAADLHGNIMTFEKCVNQGSVSGRNYVGGLGGAVHVNLEGRPSGVPCFYFLKSFSNANITGENIVGGLFGYSNIEALTCYSRGNIKANQSIVGGLLGEGVGISFLRDCYSIANIRTATDGIIGGLVGKGRQVSLSNSYFTGTSTNKYGIVGKSENNFSIINCLTSLPELGSNLDPNRIFHSTLGDRDLSDVMKNALVNIKSIKDNKSVINGNNVYSDVFWPLDVNPYYSLKFADFSTDVDVPDFDEEVIN